MYISAIHLVAMVYILHTLTCGLRAICLIIYLAARLKFHMILYTMFHVKLQTSHWVYTIGIPYPFAGPTLFCGLDSRTGLDWTHGLDSTQLAD